MTINEAFTRLQQNDEYVYNTKTEIFVQKKEAITLLKNNQKELMAMDRLVSNASIDESSRYSDVEKIFKTYAKNLIIEKNNEVIDRVTGSGVAIDLGCGKGEYLEILSKKFSLVIAVDISLEAISYAKKSQKELSNIIYVNGSALDLYRVFEQPFADFCLSAEVIEHVPDPFVYLEGARKILKEGGAFLISTPCQNLYFYPLQFLRISLTKPRTFIKLLKPLENWGFALDWHPALSKKDLIRILNEKCFKDTYYRTFRPYYENTPHLMYHFSKALPEQLGASLYKAYLEKYNEIVERLGFGVRQQVLCTKLDLTRNN